VTGIRKVNLAEKFAQLAELWSPRLVGRVNETDVRIARLRGDFVWHQHAEEDELFLVIEGRLRLEFRDGAVWLEEGEFLVVPRGVEHRPVAPEEVLVMLIEPRSTVNTGNVRNERTLESVEEL
jgi:mannose-6-phosphate isomerase-like protein (cupin superfamily)